MPLQRRLKELVLQGARPPSSRRRRSAAACSTLRMAGISKMLEGVTTPEEVLRITVAD